MVCIFWQDFARCDANGVLVATGISTTFTEFDPGRVKTLVERIHGYQR
ncbi:MAG: hypothetical protein PHX74_10520 [Candidatus Sumerlaeales bacterium]|nr:hypothetical protein [Candidatus Sumerlaeales bacterium]